VNPGRIGLFFGPGWALGRPEWVSPIAVFAIKKKKEKKRKKKAHKVGWFILVSPIQIPNPIKWVNPIGSAQYSNPF